MMVANHLAAIAGPYPVAPVPPGGAGLGGAIRSTTSSLAEVAWFLLLEALGLGIIPG